MSNERGFTLLEVMVALAILGGVVASVLTTVSYHIGVAAGNRDRVAAAVLGKERFDEIRLFGMPEKFDGSFGTDFSEFKWKLDKSYEESFGLYRLTLMLSWGRKGEGIRFISYREEG